MTIPLRELAAQEGITLSVSLLAAPVDNRVAIARTLAAEGRWVHADVIEGSFRGQKGISVEMVAELATIPGIRLDVHIMSDHPLAVIDRLPDGLARITVHDGPECAEALARARQLAGEAWISVTGEPGLAATGARPSGALVMLTPPGQPGHRADLSRLALIMRIAAQFRVGVDGGVGSDNLSRIAASGAEYAVAGRALLGG